MAMSVSMLHIKKMLPKPTKSRMSEKYKDGLRQSWGASTNNEENAGSTRTNTLDNQKVRKKGEELLSAKGIKTIPKSDKPDVQENSAVSTAKSHISSNDLTHSKKVTTISVMMQ